MMECPNVQKCNFSGSKRKQAAVANFLEVGAYVVLGAANATNLRIQNEKM